jgi:hypothetical protein
MQNITADEFYNDIAKDIKEDAPATVAMTQDDIGDFFYEDFELLCM